MQPNTSFVAPPFKRYAAWTADAFVALLLFLVANAVGEALAWDLARWEVLALVGALYQGGLLAWSPGQTFGRHVVGIQLMGDGGVPVSPAQATARALMRMAPLALLGSDGPSPLLGALALVVLWWLDLRGIEGTPQRQGLTDRWCRTLVVNLPPPHTHRAPAGPMFSATDDEFGVPPRGPRAD